MPDDLKSIEDLILSSDDNFIDEESVEGKFEKKQREIKIKEMEASTQRKSSIIGSPYIDLFSFPISSEALSLIKEEEAIKNKIVCFFYDGEKVRIGSTDPQNETIQEILSEINKKKHTKGKIYLISEHRWV